MLAVAALATALATALVTVLAGAPVPAAAADGLPGLHGHGRELPVHEVTLSAIARATLGGNLDIRIAEVGLEAAQARVMQLDAAFDPVLYGSVSYSQADSYERVSDIGRLRNLDPYADEEGDPDLYLYGLPVANPVQSAVCTITIDDQPYTASGNLVDPITLKEPKSCFEPPVFTVEPEYASGSSLKQHTVATSVGAGVKFPFGGQASIGVTTTWRKKYSFQAPALTSPLGPDDPFGWGPEGLFWTSAATASLSIPLPWTKGFGRDGASDTVSLRIAENSAQGALWGERSTRNAALQQALGAYWDLVQGAETARAYEHFRGVLNERLARQRRLFDSGLATRYDVAQVEAELASLASRQELTWNAYVGTNHRLLTLLGQEARVLLVPADGAARLEDSPMEGTGPDPGPSAAPAVFERALELHPDIRQQRIAYEASRISLAYREDQALPDISLTVTGSLGQSDAAFGYSNPGSSLSALFLDPDSANLFVGLRYRIPLGNVSARGALKRARIEERQAFDRALLTRQRVERDVDRSLSAAISNAAQAEQSDVALEQAQRAYERAVRMRDEGLVSEFEVLNRIDDMLSARLDRTAARVAQRKAQIDLLAAQGILEKEMAR